MARKITFSILVTRENLDWIHEYAMETGKTQTEIFAAALDCYRTRDTLIEAVRQTIREELQAWRAT
jgi:hypothetical protein